MVRYDLVQNSSHRSLKSLNLLPLVVPEILHIRLLNHLNANSVIFSQLKITLNVSWTFQLSIFIYSYDIADELFW